MTTQEIDLAPFCSKDQFRAGLLKPWKHAGDTWASDGRIVVRIPGHIDGAAETSQHAEAAFKVGSWNHETIEWGDLPSIPVDTFTECRECKGGGKLKRCRKCRGSGVIECGECGEESDCRACHGDGFTPCVDGDSQCEDCEGAGKIVKVQAVPIGGACVSDYYLRLIAALPNAQIPKRHIDFLAPVPFRFDGGTGYVMPMRP